MKYKIILLTLLVALSSVFQNASAEDMSHRNKTRKGLSHGLMECIIVYELTGQQDKVPPLTNAFLRYNKFHQEYYDKLHASAKDVITKNEDYMANLSTKTYVCDNLTPEQIDLGDTMKLEKWREGDAYQ